MTSTGTARGGVIATAAAVAACACVAVLSVFAGWLGGVASEGACMAATTSTTAPITLGAPGAGQTVGATEYGGPGDPGTGHIGSSGADLLEQPDSYAELGGTTFATATAMGGLPYGTPLRITWERRSVLAEKRDIGLGGGPIDGHRRVIDLWWELSEALGIPYEDGEWSGLVRVQRTPATGAANVLGEAAQSSGAGTAAELDAASVDTGGAACGAAGAAGGAGLTSGPRAVLLGSGLAEAPAGAPAAVQGMIAAGNAIAGSPYVYGGGHGIPLSAISPSYDCSSSVAHLLWGGGLLPASAQMVAADFETWGDPGPGRWVTLYASADHVFMYVAGLRWDTHDAAGPGDGTAGIGWHPLIREDDGFVVRHPPGL